MLGFNFHLLLNLHQVTVHDIALVGNQILLGLGQMFNAIHKRLGVFRELGVDCEVVWEIRSELPHFLEWLTNGLKSLETAPLLF